jgi:molybdenum cofactor guanylyltransferase
MSVQNSVSISALILAGGQGSRLGGRDKGLMPWRGQPIAARLAGLLRPLCEELLISCNRNLPEYAAWADRLVRDGDEGFPGPLAGIRAGLGACNGSHLLVVPCDLPHLDSSLLGQLLEQALSQPDRPCVTRTGESWQPLVCVLPRHRLADLDAFWEAGGRSPLRWLLGQPFTILNLADDDRRLINANNPEDWVSGEQR